MAGQQDLVRHVFAWTSVIVALLFAAPAAALQTSTVDAVKQEKVTLRHQSPDNFCLMGHFVPELFLLGTSLSGSQEFFEELSKNPNIIHYTPDDSEIYALRNPTFSSWHSQPGVFCTEMASPAKEAWAEHYPNCSHLQRRVAVDFTPTYLTSSVAVQGIHGAYPQPLSSKLVFMVFLSEPALRTAIHYDHWRQRGVLLNRFTSCTAEQYPKTFKDVVTTGMARDGVLCNCACDDILHDSMYAEGFRRYFSVFKASQFHIVPYKDAFSEDIVRYTWDLLSLEPVQQFPRTRVVAPLAAPFPHLRNQLHPATLLKFQTWMNARAGPSVLAEIFAGSGAHLFNFRSSPHDVSSITTWLASSWHQ